MADRPGMVYPLPPVLAQATVISGVYEIDFPTENYARYIRRIAIVGPYPSSLNVYIDNTLIDTTPRGDQNSSEYFVGVYLAQGQQLRLVWSVGTGRIPEATLQCDGVMI